MADPFDVAVERLPFGLCAPQLESLCGIVGLGELVGLLIAVASTERPSPISSVRARAVAAGNWLRTASY